jgi:hypothetical protein
MSKSALDCTDPLIRDIAVETKKLGTLVCVLASSFTSNFRSENAESSTRPAIDGSLFECNKAVAAPMDLPQRPTVFTFRSDRRKLTITFTSSRSCHPREMNSPSDLPQPGKSKQKRVIFACKTNGTKSTASARQELLPCMYIMQGISSHFRSVSSGSKWEHCIL